MGKTFFKSFASITPHVTIYPHTLSCSMFNDNCTNINYSLLSLKLDNSQTRTNISSSKNNFLVTLEANKEVSIKVENITIPKTLIGLSNTHSIF